MSDFIYPSLRQPPPPTTAIIDMDSLLFYAASSSENTWYIGRDKNGDEVCRWDSAKGYKSWIDEFDIFGSDMKFGYKGDPADLTRHVEYEILDAERSYKTFDKMLKSWIEQSKCTSYKGWVSKATGAKNFRYDICTLRAYKGGRQSSHKPFHLEAVRKYALTHKNIVKCVGAIEVDDIVMAAAERMKHKACLVGVDKDARQIMGSHFIIIDQMDKPVFSSKKIIGRLEQDSGSVKGYGVLHLLHQTLVGDNCDGIVGVKGVGDKRSFDILSKYSAVSMDHLPEAITDVCSVYRDIYGDSYEYKHCYSSEPITASWRDLFTENVRLLWMLRDKQDQAEFILDNIPEDF